MNVLSLIGRLADPETRGTAALALAECLGAEELILFVWDAEVDALLPAPGFPQTIPRGALWRAFLANCLVEGNCTGTMPSSRGRGDLPAWGYHVEPDGVLVLLGGSLDRAAVREILPVFPLVVALTHSERAKRALELKARMANTAAAQGQVVARALERSRNQLRDALMSSRASRAAAEEANHAKAGFLAMMSHELRTPLNAIGGYAALLEEGVMGPLVAGQREYLARIKRSQAHLLALINDVLNFAKAESGTITYHITPLDLRQVLASVAPLIEPMAAARKVRYEYVTPEEGIAVLADRDKLVQVVLNLLTNAVKFTSRGGLVRLVASARDDVAIIAVSDSGPGIPMERRASIFEPFVQLERSFTAQEREGVGLGLAISRELARGMGGDIHVESALGRGSTFELSLPRAGAVAKARAEQPVAVTPH